MFDEKNQASLADALEKWSEAVDQKISKRPERKPEFINTSGIPIQRLYTPLDNPEKNYPEGLGFPGEYPYTRGVQPTMYRGRFWTMRQYAGFASAEESNKRYRFLLDQGQTGLSVAFDLPTQIGYDSDNEIAIGEVGKVGVANRNVKSESSSIFRPSSTLVPSSLTINGTAI